jgi:hypothetical protein
MKQKVFIEEILNIAILQYKILTKKEIIKK